MFFKAATVVLALAASSLPFATAAASCSRSYTVKVGDTCYGIAASQSVSSYQLAVNNPSINSGCTNLQVGQNLCLGNEGEDCQDTLVVEAGDTCDDLMECAGLNSTVFFLNNPTVNEECSNLEIGQVVCVASQVTVPPMGADEGAPSSAPPAPVNVAPSPSVQPSSVAVPASPSPSVQPSSAAAIPASPSPTVHSSAPASTATDGGDDGDLPFCDELEDEDEQSWN